MVKLFLRTVESFYLDKFTVLKYYINFIKGKLPKRKKYSYSFSIELFCLFCLVFTLSISEN